MFLRIQFIVALKLHGHVFPSKGGIPSLKRRYSFPQRAVFLPSKGGIPSLKRRYYYLKTQYTKVSLWTTSAFHIFVITPPLTGLITMPQF